MTPDRCPICLSSERRRIEGWILSGLGWEQIAEWCRQLDPPIECSRWSVDDHLDEGHIDVGKAEVTAMLVKYNREAAEVIDAALKNPGAIKGNVLNTAMTVRMRAIELIAKANSVIETGSRTVNQELNVVLSPSVQKRMLEAEIKKLEAVEDADTKRIASEPSTK